MNKLLAGLLLVALGLGFAWAFGSSSSPFNQPKGPDDAWTFDAWREREPRTFDIPPASGQASEEASPKVVAAEEIREQEPGGTDAPTGSPTVEVRLLTRDGHELGGGLIAIGLATPSNSERPTSQSARGSQPVRFTGLKAGEPFTLRVSSELSGFDPELVEPIMGTVPSFGEPPLNVDLRLPVDFGAYAHMRLVDAGGRALSHRDVMVGRQMFDGAVWWGGASRRTTGPGGELKAELDGRMRDWNNDQVVLLSIACQDDEGEWLFSELPRFKGGLKDGPAELGDVAMVRGEILLAGTVVDQDGRPLAGAEVELELGTAWPQPVRPGQLASTMPLARQSAAPSAPDGSFVVRGLSRASAHFVRTRLDGYASNALISFPVGKADARLVMQASGSIAGRWRDVAAGTEVYIRPQDEAKVPGFSPIGMGNSSNASSSGWVGSEVADDGRFGWSGLTPGLYTVRPGGDAYRDQTQWLRDVRVVAGEVAADSRLFDAE